MESMAGSELMKAQAHVLNHVFNFISSFSLKCAVQLDIPDVIHNHGRPMTLSNLVKGLSLAPSKTPHLHRLMRLLVHSGFFAIHEINEEEGYVLTPSSKLLLSHKSTSLKPYVINIINPVFITPFHFYGDWFRGNEATTFETVHGMTLWDYVAQHKEFSDYFYEAMASDTRLVMGVVLKECKEAFEGCRSLMDVGGGTGIAAEMVAEAFPNMKCIVFDLPHVVTNLPKKCDNLEFVGGNMFESIPSADAIFIKSVLHNWSDEDCVKILKRCRESLASKENAGKVILIESVMMDNNGGDYEATESRFFFDLLMMVLHNGKQRTEKEWEKLFLESGFSHYKISHVLGLRSLIEVFP